MLPIKIDAISARAVSVPYLSLRVISRGSETHANMAEVTLTAQGATGRGEAHPLPRYGETMAAVLAEIDAVRPHLEAGCSREDLRRTMPPGAARNAVDCALWDLEAKLSGVAAEEIAGVSPCRSLTSVYTLSLLTPDEMGEEAAREAHRPILKVKLGHYADDRARLEAIRKAAPNAELVLDANEGWTFEQAREMAQIAADCGVILIEQPVHADRDEPMKNWRSPVPIAADEACHTCADLDRIVDRGYDVVNIKLDKTGGLTEALLLAEAARARGLGLMVGCMSGTTLAMAPGFILAQLCQFVDLDSPLFQPALPDPDVAYDLSDIFWAPERRWGLPDHGRRAAL